MDNIFKYSDSNLRYHTLNYYLKNKYYRKVFKVPLDAGFSCPNRDGTCGYGGCTFCSSEGSGEFSGSRSESLMTQYHTIKQRMEVKWPNALTIPYFQAYTNTYASLSEIKQMIEPFIVLDETVAISLATRPDCLNDDTIEYLNSLTNKKDIWIELGLQTIHDQTARAFNRGYDFEVFVDTVYRLAKTNIKVSVHILNGLPHETETMMIETAKAIAVMPIDGIKIHMLHLLSDSIMGQNYLTQPFELLTQDEYCAIVAKQLEVLPAKMIIERLTGDAMKEKLIAPMWTLKKFIVMNDIQKYLVQHNSYQGKYYQVAQNINDVVKQWIDTVIDIDCVVIDATLGNGHDSYYLADKVKQIYGFDIQKQAINNSKEKCRKFNNITYINDSHESFNNYVADKVDLIIYNLGYLPNGDKSIITTSSSTIKSLESAKDTLNDDGHIIITFYRRHLGGMDEHLAVIEMINNNYHIINSYCYPYDPETPISYLLRKKSHQ